VAVSSFFVDLISCSVLHYLTVFTTLTTRDYKIVELL